MTQVPYRLKRVDRLDEIAPIFNNPYNAPDLVDTEQEERFYEEYKRYYSLIHSKLEKLGNIDAFGKTEFSMGNPWNNNRQIGVIVNTERLFIPALIDTLWKAVQEIPVKYLVALEGEYKAGGGNFYICFTKGDEVVGYAPNRSMLAPFGFT